MPNRIRRATRTTTITLIGLSDYHSHAVPFFSEGKMAQAGIARVIAYLKAQRQSVKNLLILSGGDTMNLGTPIWSDYYLGLEWPWFNGLVDAMALGNHDMDYGPEVLKQCQSTINYPIICSNLIDPETEEPIFTVDGKPYLIKLVDGVKLGLFTLAGNDFEQLIKPETRPGRGIWANRPTCARRIIKELREKEQVDAVIYFGHASTDEDMELARSIDGIDVILGSHSHFKSELVKLPGTETWFISPYQYLTYLSRVELTFVNRQLREVTGGLVRMDETQPEDPEIAGQVRVLQANLEKEHPERFQVLGTAEIVLSYANIESDETLLGNWALDTLRRTAQTHAYFIPAIYFRSSLPSGPITVEDFYSAFPYKNSIVVAEMTGQQLLDLINLSVSRRGSESFSQLSGVCFSYNNGRAADVRVLADPQADAVEETYFPLDLTRTYQVGTISYMAYIAPDYRGFFAGIGQLTHTKRDIATLLTATIKATSPITASLDGRMGTPAKVRQGLRSKGKVVTLIN